MSQLLYSGLTTVLATLFDDNVAEQFNRSAVLASWLPQSATRGRNVNFAVRAGDGQVASSSIYLAEGADVTAFDYDTKVKASLEFADVSAAFNISGKALDAAWASGDPLELENLFAEEMLDCSHRLASNLNKELYVGDGGVVSSAQTIQGLIGDGYAGTSGWIGTANVAGINRGTYTSMVPTILSNSGTPRNVSLALLNQLQMGAYVRSGSDLDAFVCDATQWANIQALYTATTTQFVVPASEGTKKLTYNAGAQTLAYAGVPIIKDKDCPAGIVIGLSRKAVSMRSMAMAPQGMSFNNTSAGMMKLRATQESQFQSEDAGIDVKLHQLATSGDYVKFQMIARPQLVVSRPNACGLLTDLTNSFVSP